MKNITQNNIDHLKRLHHTYKLASKAETKIRFLENYVKMLETEINHLEIKSANRLKSTGKQGKFGKIKRFFKCSFDLDNTIKPVSEEVSQIMAGIQHKHKEIELSKYELTTLSVLFSNKELINKEYSDYFEVILLNYRPEDLTNQGIMQKFESEKAKLEIKKKKTAFEVDKVKEVKNLIDEVHRLFGQIAYGYQDKNTINYNIFNIGAVKKIRALSKELLLIFPQLFKNESFSHLEFLSAGEEKILSIFNALSNFQKLFNKLDYSYTQYGNTLTALKIKINEDLKKLNYDLGLIDDKINHLSEEKRNWFRKILNLD